MRLTCYFAENWSSLLENTTIVSVNNKLFCKKYSLMLYQLFAFAVSTTFFRVFQLLLGLFLLAAFINKAINTWLLITKILWLPKIHNNAEDELHHLKLTSNFVSDVIRCKSFSKILQYIEINIEMLSAQFNR